MSLVPTYMFRSVSYLLIIVTHSYACASSYVRDGHKAWVTAKFLILHICSMSLALIIFVISNQYAITRINLYCPCECLTSGSSCDTFAPRTKANDSIARGHIQLYSRTVHPSPHLQYIPYDPISRKQATAWHIPFHKTIM